MPSTPFLFFIARLRNRTKKLLISVSRDDNKVFFNKQDKTLENSVFYRKFFFIFLLFLSCIRVQGNSLNIIEGDTWKLGIFENKKKIK